MTVFDKAWQVVKMARHVIGNDVEIWDWQDRNDRFGSPEGLGPGYENLEPEELDDMPKDFGWMNTFGDDWELDEEGHWIKTKKPKEDWRSWVLGVNRGSGMDTKYNLFSDNEEVLPKGRDKPYTEEEMIEAHQKRWDENRPHYYPISAGQFLGDAQAKIMMTPKEYLGLAADPPREKRSQSTLDYMRGLIERNAARGVRTPIGMPTLELGLADEVGVYPYGEDGDEVLSGPRRYNVLGHEGRHRMQTLTDLGYGDVPVPVLAGLRELDKHSFGIHHTPGRSKNWEDSLIDSILLPEERSMWNEDPNWRKVHPDEREEWKKGIHPEAMSHRVRAINDFWDKGGYQIEHF